MNARKPRRRVVRDRTRSFFRRWTYRLVGMLRRWRSGVLVTAGFGALCRAAFEAGDLAGWAVVGVSLFLLELCTRKGPA